MPGAERPRDHAAPVVPHDVRALQPGGVQQGQDVGRPSRAACTASARAAGPWGSSPAGRARACAARAGAAAGSPRPTRPSPAGTRAAGRPARRPAVRRPGRRRSGRPRRKLSTRRPCQCHDEWGPEAPARSGTEPPREAVSRKGAGGLLTRGREGLKQQGTAPGRGRRPVGRQSGMELIVLVDDDGTAIGTMPKPRGAPRRDAAAPGLLRLPLRRRRPPADHPAGRGQGDVPGHVDQHGLRPSRSGRGRRRRDRPARRVRARPARCPTSVRPCPGYRYRAEFRGVVENEICPVYLGRFTGTPAPEPSEVGEWQLLDGRTSARGRSPRATRGRPGAASRRA